MTRLALAAVTVAALACAGCVGSLSAPRTSDPRCIALDDTRSTLGGVAATSAPAAGALGGIAAVPGVSTEARLALAGGAVVASAIATYAGFKGAATGDAYARECSAAPAEATR